MEEPRASWSRSSRSSARSRASPAARRRHHQPQLPRALRRRRLRGAHLRQGHRAARDRPRRRARGDAAAARRLGVAPGGRRVPRRRAAAWSPRFVDGRAGRAERAARAGDARRGRRGAARASTTGAAARRRASPFRVVEDYRATALARGGACCPSGCDDGRALAGAHRGGAAGPDHAPRPVPQRPAAGQLPRRRRRGCGSSTGSTPGMGDRFFDLGNLSVNNGFDDADDERAARGLPRATPCTPRSFAALRLMRADVRRSARRCGASSRRSSPTSTSTSPRYADEHFAPRARVAPPTRASRSGSRDAAAA